MSSLSPKHHNQYHQLPNSNFLSQEHYRSIPEELLQYPIHLNIFNGVIVIECPDIDCPKAADNITPIVSIVAEAPNILLVPQSMYELCEGKPHNLQLIMPHIKQDFTVCCEEKDLTDPDLSQVSFSNTSLHDLTMRFVTPSNEAMFAQMLLDNEHLLAYSERVDSRVEGKGIVVTNTLANLEFLYHIKEWFPEIDLNYTSSLVKSMQAPATRRLDYSTYSLSEVEPNSHFEHDDVIAFVEELSRQTSQDGIKNLVEIALKELALFDADSKIPLLTCDTIILKLYYVKSFCDVSIATLADVISSSSENNLRVFVLEQERNFKAKMLKLDITEAIPCYQDATVSSYYQSDSKIESYISLNGKFICFLNQTDLFSDIAPDIKKHVLSGLEIRLEALCEVQCRNEVYIVSEIPNIETALQEALYAKLLEEPEKHIVNYTTNVGLNQLKLEEIQRRITDTVSLEVWFTSYSSIQFDDSFANRINRKLLVIEPQIQSLIDVHVKISASFLHFSHDVKTPNIEPESETHLSLVNKLLELRATFIKEFKALRTEFMGDLESESIFDRVRYSWLFDKVKNAYYCPIPEDKKSIDKEFNWMFRKALEATSAEEDLKRVVYPQIKEILRDHVTAFIDMVNQCLPSNLESSGLNFSSSLEEVKVKFIERAQYLAGASRQHADIYINSDVIKGKASEDLVSYVAGESLDSSGGLHKLIRQEESRSCLIAHEAIHLMQVSDVPHPAIIDPEGIYQKFDVAVAKWSMLFYQKGIPLRIQNKHKAIKFQG
jgi:hypothetical protein